MATGSQARNTMTEVRVDGAPPLQNEDVIPERRLVFELRFQHLHERKRTKHFSVLSLKVGTEMEQGENETTEDAHQGLVDGGKLGGKGVCKGVGEAETSTSALPNRFYDRLLQELKSLKPEICCFQSVNECAWFKLQNALEDRGYQGIRKSRRDGTKSEAIFFLTKRFELLKSYGMYLDDIIMNQTLQSDVLYPSAVKESVTNEAAVIILTLQCKLTGRQLKVANTSCLPECQQRPDLQAIQMCCILKELGESDVETSNPTSIILAGWMDFQPQDRQYKFLRQGFLNEDICNSFEEVKSVKIGYAQIHSLVHVYKGGFHHSWPMLNSAYSKVLGSEPRTIYSEQTDCMKCGTYLFFDEGQLNVVGVLDVDPSSIVSATGIQYKSYFSRNIPIKAIFEFGEKESVRGTPLMMYPSGILFSQNTIRGKLDDGTDLDETLKKLLDGKLTIVDLPLMQVVFDDGSYWALSGNRRLYLFRKLEELGVVTRIPVLLMPINDERVKDRFYMKKTTVCEGKTISVRAKKTEESVQKVIESFTMSSGNM